jgi:hypothetical protein
MPTPIERALSEHLANCRLLDLVEHADLATGILDADRTLHDTVQERVTKGVRLLPPQLTTPDGPLSVEGRSNLIAFLTIWWDLSPEELSRMATKIDGYIDRRVELLQSLALSALHRTPTYIATREAVLFSVQVYVMMKEMVSAKKRLPTAVPDAAFFHTLLPMLVHIQFESVLTPEIREMCPNMW